jgi:hypothetical protein
MKSLVQSIVIAAALTAPVAVFAQSNAPVTRVQVKAELVQFEQAGGVRALANDPYYPESAQTAQARIVAQNGNAQAYGGAHAGSSAAGAPVQADGLQPLYFGK